MLQKDDRIERRTNAMDSVVAARHIHQWNCQDCATQSILGLPMDHAIRNLGIPGGFRMGRSDHTTNKLVGQNFVLGFSTGRMSNAIFLINPLIDTCTHQAE